MYDRHYVEFSCHPHCGMGTYLVPGKEGGWKPITEYVDPDRFWEIFKDAYEQARAGHKTRAKLSLVARGVRRIGFEFLRRYLMPVFLKANYSSLADLHHRMIFLGLMHFMDPYNFDLRRAERCVIHYAVPDGRIISFCTMNSIHRPDVERKFAIPIERWREEHGGAPLDAVA
ncbi:MAG TPA: radical SAM protein [Candidatus Latescibacteria bacterium]|nr:radical SAM protein [Candidatus Latescibacterota bacterium]